MNSQEMDNMQVQTISLSSTLETAPAIALCSRLESVGGEHSMKGYVTSCDVIIAANGRVRVLFQHFFHPSFRSDGIL